MGFHSWVNFVVAQEQVSKMIWGTINYLLQENVKLFSRDEELLGFTNFYVNAHTLVETILERETDEERLIAELTNFYDIEINHGYSEKMVDALKAEYGDASGFARKFLEDLEENGNIRKTNGKYSWDTERYRKLSVGPIQ